MDFNIDVLKQIRETIDWLIAKYKIVTDNRTKEQLNKIANQIAKIAVSKSAYIHIVKAELNSGSEDIDLGKIRSAIKTAELDTEELSKLLTESPLDSKKVTFALKYGLEELAIHKQLTITKLKEIVGKENVNLKEQEEIIKQLQSFKEKWIEIGGEIDNQFQK